MPFTRSALAGAVFLFLPLTPLVAQQATAGSIHSRAADTVDEVIVTSSRVPIPAHRIATSVAVLTEEDIVAHGNLSLVDVLRQMPGSSSAGNGGAGKATSLRIRGEEGFRTLTLLDGMRLLDPSLPQIGPQMEQLLSSGVGRVEVLRGPQGLGYGADAGGVVNIFTRRAGGELQGDLAVESGSFGTRQLAGNVSGVAGAADYFFSAVDLHTDGFNSRPSDAVLRDDDGYQNTTLHGRLGYQFDERWRLDLVHREVTGESEFDGCFTVAVVHDCKDETRQQGSRLALEYGTPGATHSLSYALTRARRDSLAEDQLAFANRGSLERWEYTGSLTALTGLDLVFGADLESAANGGLERDNRGVYLEALSDFSDRLFLTAGVRHDHNDSFGDNTSYRLSAAYLVELAGASLLKFRTALGSGFRSPSLYEIQYNNGPFAFPPAATTDLEQEVSRGYELGIEYLAGNGLRIEAVYFDQQVEDAIYFDLAGFSGYLQDTGTSYSEGVELSAAYRLTEHLEVAGNYTFNDTQRPDGRQRIRRPEQLANLALTYRAMNERLQLNAFYRLSRDSVDEVFGTVMALDDFAVLDLRANYQVSDALSLFVRVENATDKQYREVIDYNTADRAVYVGLRFDL